MEAQLQKEYEQILRLDDIKEYDDDLVV